MFVRSLLLVMLLVVSAAPRAAEARIVKVLPHFLDAKGRNALAPSLYERDAYQAYLRAHPAEIASLRFDVQYKATNKTPLVLRIEIRGSRMPLGRSRIFETDLDTRGWFSHWGELHLDKKTYDEIGSVVAWRATLRQDGKEIAAQQSFLW